MKIVKTQSNFEREPLKNPFGFKGRFIQELWQIVANVSSSNYPKNYGLGVQSPLWSDPKVFVEYGETASNCLMYLTTEYALRLSEGIDFKTPIDLLDTIFPDVYTYSRKVTDNPNLSETFSLNGLVPVDYAVWRLYCRENNISSFDMMIPDFARPVLSKKAERMANIPLISYNMSEKEMQSILEEGYPVLKIKIGSDPDKDGDKNKMLQWDQQRLSQIHNIAKHYESPHTYTKNILYYLDANAQYQNKETLLRFLDYADKIGALERIVLLEEPFPEEYKIDVHDIPVRLVADESAHSDTDAAERIQMGYRAIALKPIAKTLSMSYKIAAIAYAQGIPCFCADLTVNPLMAEWNKNFAARLSPLPELKIAVVESNGFQNYKNWDIMKSYHPIANAPWTKMKNGIFELGEDFYRSSGGVFQESQHYSALC